MKVMKDDQRKRHGLHNENICEILHQMQRFPDWVITTSFYASLHFVSYRIFPFEHSPKGVRVTINNMEQWQSFKSYASNKRHTLLKELVSKYCPRVSAEYEWLLTMSMAARYYSYQFEVEIVNKAVACMKQIKRNCLS